MINIETIITNVLALEGGFINNPLDKGGPTNHGITLAALNEFTGYKNNEHDIQILTQVQARAIYRRNYYTTPHINQLPEEIQPLVFDMAVNHGPKTAIKLLQSQLLANGYFPGAIDGIIGPQTVTAATKAIGGLSQVLINNLVNRRIQLYQSIIKKDKSQAAFAKGWIARAETFRPVALV